MSAEAGMCELKKAIFENQIVAMLLHRFDEELPEIILLHSNTSL